MKAPSRYEHRLHWMHWAHPMTSHEHPMLGHCAGRAKGSEGDCHRIYPSTFLTSWELGNSADASFSTSWSHRAFLGLPSLWSIALPHWWTHCLFWSDLEIGRILCKHWLYDAWPYNASWLCHETVPWCKIIWISGRSLLCLATWSDWWDLLVLHVEENIRFVLPSAPFGKVHWS